MTPLRTFLVTGGCGFIGSHFIKLLVKHRPSCRIINLDLLTYAGNLANLVEVTNLPCYQFVQGDIADSKLIHQLIRDEKVDAIVNFAAETHVDRSLIDSAPFVRTNVQGTQVLLEAAYRNNSSRFLQVSTDEVYGSLSPLDPTFTEDDALKPNSPYAATKASADLLVRAYYKSYGVPVLITRCGNNYGPFQFPEKFLPLCITNALEGRPVPIYGDGQQIRDWIYVEDHAKALLLVLEHGRIGEVYNIGADSEKTNISLAEASLDLLDRPRSLITYVTDRLGHDRRYGINPGKIRTELGWSPSVCLDDGLRATIEWFRRERDWWHRIKNGEYRRYYETQYHHRLENSGDE